MKWHATNLYLKTAAILGTLTALALAAGAEWKW
jgi:hypothetical protein